MYCQNFDHSHLQICSWVVLSTRSTIPASDDKRIIPNSTDDCYSWGLNLWLSHQPDSYPITVDLRSCAVGSQSFSWQKLAVLTVVIAGCTTPLGSQRELDGPWR